MNAVGRTGARLRRATDRDWTVFTALPVPVCWFGMVAESYMILGLGGAYLGTDQRWWCVFARAPGVRGLKLMAHKAALTTLEIADGMELDLHATADLTIDGSEFWLSRLGFEKTDEEIEGQIVWGRKSQSSEHWPVLPGQVSERLHNQTP